MGLPGCTLEPSSIEQSQGHSNLSHLCVFLLVWLLLIMSLKQGPHVQSVKEPQRASVSQFGREKERFESVPWWGAMGRGFLYGSRLSDDSPELPLWHSTPTSSHRMLADVRNDVGTCHAHAQL